jgi:hypothetical protein
MCSVQFELSCQYLSFFFQGKKVHGMIYTMQVKEA